MLWAEQLFKTLYAGHLLMPVVQQNSETAGGYQSSKHLHVQIISHPKKKKEHAYTTSVDSDWFLSLVSYHCDMEFTASSCVLKENCSRMSHCSATERVQIILYLMHDVLISAVLEEVIGSTGNHLMLVFFLSQKTKQIHFNVLQF